jgi:hypothetical protein
VIVTSSGRPVGRFPLFKWTDREGGYLLTLSRIDVSDAGNTPRAEAFYSPLFKKDDRDGMETWEFHFFDVELILFFSPKKVTYHAERHNQETE